MKSLPKVLVSSVVRSTHQGESHGGLYLVELDRGFFSQVLDWNDGSISWEGRGGDRGLRGIAYCNEEIYVAASDEMFVLDKKFSIIRTFRNRYLKHCHEIFFDKGKLYLTSTGFDSILVYDTTLKRFIKGYCIRQGKGAKFLSRKFGGNWGVRLDEFDPEKEKGPSPGDTWHVNSVSAINDTIYASGTGSEVLYAIRNDRLKRYSKIPRGTHNVRPMKNGVLMNNTESGHVEYRDLKGCILAKWRIKTYEKKELTHKEVPEDHARQGFGRGLCVWRNKIIIGGSSPATISVYSFERNESISSVNLTMDIRNAVHGLEIWPFD